MAEAKPSISSPTLQYRDAKEGRRLYAEMQLAVMARFLARQIIKEQYRAEGKTPDPVVLANKTTAYVREHRARLRLEALLVLSGEDLQ
jgi:hypothetical protein